MDGTNDSTTIEHFTFDKFGHLIQIIGDNVNNDSTIDSVGIWTYDYDYRNRTYASFAGAIDTNGVIDYFYVATGVLNAHREVVSEVMN